MNSTNNGPRNQTAPAPPLTTIGGYFLGCPEVDAAYNELRAKGAPVREPVVTGYGMKQMCVSRSGRICAVLPVASPVGLSVA